MKNIHSKTPHEAALQFGLQWSLYDFSKSFRLSIWKNEVFKVLPFIYLIKIPKIPLINRQWLNIEVGWIGNKWTTTCAEIQVCETLGLDGASQTSVGSYSGWKKFQTSPLVGPPKWDPRRGVIRPTGCWLLRRQGLPGTVLATGLGPSSWTLWWSLGIISWKSTPKYDCI